MSVYKVKNAPNTALVSLDTMTPQPRSPGLKFSRMGYSANGSVYAESPYIELVFDVIESAASYATLLAQFGLNASTPSSSVTVYVPNAIYSFARYNGTAIRPPTSRENFFIRNVVIVVKDLVAL